MRRFSVFLLLLALAVIPVRGADWLMHSGNPQRTGWQKDETKISKDSVKNLKLLYSIKLDTKQRSVYSLYGPLILERAITDRGFKELAFVAGASNDLYAVDADLGTRVLEEALRLAGRFAGDRAGELSVSWRTDRVAGAATCSRSADVDRAPASVAPAPTAPAAPGAAARAAARRQSVRDPLALRPHRRRQPASGQRQHGRRSRHDDEVPAAQRQAATASRSSTTSSTRSPVRAAAARRTASTRWTCPIRRARSATGARAAADCGAPPVRPSAPTARSTRKPATVSTTRRRTAMRTRSSRSPRKS